MKALLLLGLLTCSLATTMASTDEVIVGEKVELENGYCKKLAKSDREEGKEIAKEDPRVEEDSKDDSSSVVQNI